MTVDLVEMFGGLPRSSEDLRGRAERAGWWILHEVLADRAEWDDLEERFGPGLREFAAREPGHLLALEAKRFAEERRNE